MSTLCAMRSRISLQARFVCYTIVGEVDRNSNYPSKKTKQQNSSWPLTQPKLYATFPIGLNYIFLNQFFFNIKLLKQSRTNNFLKCWKAYSLERWREVGSFGLYSREGSHEKDKLSSASVLNLHFICYHSSPLLYFLFFTPSLLLRHQVESYFKLLAPGR